jgi:hypothetical protein
MPRRGVVKIAVIFLLASCASNGSQTTSPPSPPPAPSPSIVYPILTGPTGHVKIAPIPEGTYEVTVTRKDALRLGVEKCVGPFLADNTGHIALTFSNGHFRWHQSAAHRIGVPLLTGIYTGTERRVTLHFDPNRADEGEDTLQWSFGGRILYLKVLIALPKDPQGRHMCAARLVYESHPWLKTS